MNFPGVIRGVDPLHAEMADARAAGKVIGGHYASFDLGRPFHGYVAGGPQDDHEGTRLEDAVARLRQGIAVMMRHGSEWHDVAAQLRAITERGLDSRHVMLVTDDCHAATLIEEGHMDRVVRHAIEQGADPLVAIQMATLNTAEHFGVATDVGQIAPGRYADLLLVPDLRTLAIEGVIAKGRVAATGGELRVAAPGFAYPARFRSSVHLARELAVEDFDLPVGPKGPVQANVIGIVESQAPNRHLRVALRPVAGRLTTDYDQDLAKVALVERHRGSGQIQVGLVKGFGFRVPCAVASTVAHDCHQMLVVGMDEASMAVAANELARVGGGQIVVRAGEPIALVELPIAGLMSDEPAERVAAKVVQLLRGFRDCGCTLDNPTMQLTFLALVVIPELRISDRGLIDVERFEVRPVVEAQPGPS
jgi:adenine deaminase